MTNTTTVSKPKIDMSTIKPKPTYRKGQTFSDFLTDNERHPERIDLFKELAKKSPKWRTEWSFFKLNVTGSVDTMSAENIKKVERIKNELISDEMKDLE